MFCHHNWIRLPFTTISVVILLTNHFIPSIIAQESDGDDVSAIFYEKPSMARLTSGVSKQLHKGCVYNKQKYINGQEVDTNQPCLQCTCKKGILLCSLRVCPPVTAVNQSTPNTRCHIVRNPNTCCPTLECIAEVQQNEFGMLYNEFKSEPKAFSTVTPLINVNSSQFKNSLLDSKRDNTPVLINHLVSRNTTVLQTVPSSTFPDKEVPLKNSPVFIPKPSMNEEINKHTYVSDLLDGFGKHCYINETFYAEGSAILATSYCEYCYCIRGKRMCIRPRCHLSIFGCLPKYTSEYACCPTSYACGDDALTNTAYGESSKQWPLTYSMHDVLLSNHYDDPVNLETTTQSDSFILDNEITEASNWNVNTAQSVDSRAASQVDEQVTTTSTSITSTTMSSKGIANIEAGEDASIVHNSVLRMTDCIMDGVSYKVGDAMPAGANCTHCFCAVDGIRICKRIQCSLWMDHDCTPIIPEGHCCPLEYKCPPRTETNLTDANELSANSSTEATTITTLIAQSTSTPQQQTNSTPFTEDSTTVESVTSTSQNVVAESTTKTLEILVSNETDQKASVWPNVVDDTADDEINLVLSNSHSGLRSKLAQNISSNNELQLEGRDLSDDSYLAKDDNSTASSNSDQSDVKLQNPISSSAKYENVANFLNNIFTALGFNGKDSGKNELHSKREDLNSIKSNDFYNSMILVENSELPSKSSFIETSKGDQVEIVTAQPEDPLNLLEAMQANDNQFKQVSTSVEMFGKQGIQLPTVKSVREFPPFSNPNQLSPIEKNYMQPIPSVLNQKATVFSNGWRAIPNQKPNHKQQAFLVPIRRPIPNETFKETAVNVAATVSPTTTSSMEGVQIKNMSFLKTSLENSTPTNKLDINQMKCLIDGNEYDNGALIPNGSENPCIYCRCFYGKQICQEQKCPSPPSSDCVSEKETGQCCPLYTCKIATNVSSDKDSNEHGQDHLQEKSPIRKGPQFVQENTPTPTLQVSDRNANEILSKDQNISGRNRFEENKQIIPIPINLPPYAIPPSQPRISFPFDPLPRPIDLYNRIHFPNKNKVPAPPPNLILPSKINGMFGPPVLPFINRPRFPFQAPKPFMEGNDDNSQMNVANNSPIRTRPQSPILIEKPIEKENNKGPQLNLRPQTTQPFVSETVPLSTTSTTSGPLVKPHAVPASHEPWNILQVSGCNIYGKMHQTNEEIKELSNDCKKCLCTSMGVQCNEIC